MNISRIFIDRPIMTTLVMVGILLFGVISYFQLPVSDLPSVDFPTILVTANLPGASPEMMASSVATPLEQQFSTIAGLDSMNSTSSLGSTQITLQFNLSRNLDSAAQDVQAAISTSLRKLPVGMPAPPSLRKVNPADQPIIYLSLSSSYLPLSAVDEYAETLIAQRVSMVSGVAQVMVFGSQKYAVRVQLDPKALATRNIGINEVSDAVQKGNVNTPLGALYGQFRTFTVESNGQLSQAKDYRPLIVTYRNGAPVRLQDLGTVIDSVENDKTASWLNNTRGIILAVQRQPGTNTIQVINDIKKLLPQFNHIIPASVQLHIVYDRSNSIRQSVNDVQLTLFITLILVVFVIFLFLRSFFATLISCLALPMSIIGTFAAMFLLGYSLDNLSLMALTLCVGFVVDDAIVMLENITRHMEMGVAPFQAALIGAREIGFTILSMTCSLVAVFIPILFMSGLIGRLFHEFAMTITVAILISGFISLTLTPMLCSRFLKIQRLEKTHPLLAVSEHAYEKLFRLYEWTLKKGLQYRRYVILLFFALLVVTASLFVAVPKGFMPTEDTGQIFGATEGSEGISFQSMKHHQQELAAILAKDPNINQFVSNVQDSNTGKMFATLVPRPKRKLTSDEVIQELRPKLAKVPGIQVFLQTPPTIRIGGQLTKSLYQLTLQSPDTQTLYRATTTLEDKIKDMPGLQDVTTDMQISSPQLYVKIDREKASALGVMPAQIEDAISDAYATRQISTIYTSSNNYQVIIELTPAYQQDLNALNLMYIRSNTGQLIPLNTMVKIERTVGPLSINHLGQFPSTTISFNLAPGISLGDKIQQIQTLARETLPDTVRSSFQGSAQAFQSSLQGMGILLVVAILVIYLVLGILYESFVHPITILSGLPPAGLGALLTLMIFHKELDIYGFLGLILLIGIVKKNAIMMIDFALDAQREQNLSAEEAIYTASLIRFRPIMMTTLAALMGSLPLAIGFGTGSESRQTMGLAVFGGLLVSQLLTLYITPVIYIYLDRFRERFSKSYPLDEMATEASL